MIVGCRKQKPSFLQVCAWTSGNTNNWRTWNNLVGQLRLHRKWNLIGSVPEICQYWFCWMYSWWGCTCYLQQLITLNTYTGTALVSNINLINCVRTVEIDSKSLFQIIYYKYKIGIYNNYAGFKWKNGSKVKITI